MDIEAFLVCDAATNQSGKLNVLGAFDCIIPPAMPHVHPQFAIALRVRFKKSESGNHPFRITVVDEDGKAIMPPLNGNVSVQIAAAEEHATVNITLTANQIKFEKYGRYSVDLTIAGRACGSLPLFVKPPPTA
jgi:hypothetical protein